MSHLGPCGRLIPRWSVASGPEPSGGVGQIVLPPSISGLPACGRRVRVGPPLLASGPRSGLIGDTDVPSPVAVRAVADAGRVRAVPDEIVGARRRCRPSEVGAAPCGGRVAGHHGMAQRYRPIDDVDAAADPGGAAEAKSAAIDARAARATESRRRCRSRWYSSTRKFRRIRRRCHRRGCRRCRHCLHRNRRSGEDHR